MSFEDKRSLWYISGNSCRGDVYAIPATEIGEEFKQHTSEIVQLANSLDGARRWIVVAPSGEKAVKKLVAFCRSRG